MDVILAKVQINRWKDLSAHFQWKLPTTAWKAKVQSVDLDYRESVAASVPMDLAASLQMHQGESAEPMLIPS